MYLRHRRITFQIVMKKDHVIKVIWILLGVKLIGGLVQTDAKVVNLLQQHPAAVLA